MRKICELTLNSERVTVVVSDRQKTLEFASDWSEQTQKSSTYTSIGSYPVILYNKTSARKQSVVKLTTEMVEEVKALYDVLFSYSDRYKADLQILEVERGYVFVGSLNIMHVEDPYAMFLDSATREFSYLDIDNPLVNQCKLVYDLVRA